MTDEEEMAALFDDAYADILARDNEEEAPHREKYVRGPLYGYMGCKLTALPKILPKLPYSHVFVDVFGGSGTVMLNRKNSVIDVFNDRHSGVVAFFRTIRNPEEREKLFDLISMTPYSREEFIHAKDTFYNREFVSDLERAHAWYIMVTMSYAGNSRTFQRWLPGSNRSAHHRIHAVLPHIHDIGRRFADCVIENLDWRMCLKDFDSDKTVFYLDPPYVDMNEYKLKMTYEDHLEMCKTIMSLKGFVMLSGTPNELYSRFPWDHHEKWLLTGTYDSKWSRYDAIWIKDFAH